MFLLTNLYIVKEDYFFLTLNVFYRFHADSSPGLITNKNNQSENEVFPSEEHDTIGAKYYLSTGKDLPYCRKYLASNLFL